MTSSVKTEVPLSLRSADEATRALLEAERTTIEFLVNTESLAIEEPSAERPKGAALSAGAGVEVLVTLKGIVDADKEQNRVDREIKKTEKDIAALEKKLGAKGFTDRAPAEVVQQSRDDLEAAKKRRSLLDESRQAGR